MLRRLLADYVPPELFERPKQGFNIPIGQWLKGELRDWAQNLLDRKLMEEQGFFDASQIEKVWQDHLKGVGNHSEKLWVVLMFQDWLARWG